MTTNDVSCTDRPVVGVVLVVVPGPTPVEGKLLVTLEVADDCTFLPSCDLLPGRWAEDIIADRIEALLAVTVRRRTTRPDEAPGWAPMVALGAVEGPDVPQHAVVLVHVMHLQEELPPLSPFFRWATFEEVAQMKLSAWEARALDLFVRMS